MDSQNAQLMITTQDNERLNALINSLDTESIEFLEEELARAQVVPQEQIPDDVVTMNSVVTFRDEITGDERQVALVYPNNADLSKDRVSILAPLGAALLGLRVGQTINWPVPGGKLKRLRVLNVSFQPEALGVFDL